MRLGILGGIAPPSTVDYYRRLTEGYRERSGDGSYPSILIDSVDAQAFLRLVSGDDREPLIAFLLQELERLAGAGAGLALFASNTPHVVFDEVAAASPVPLVSIVEATVEAARSRGHRRLGLLGAGITMERDFYPRAFARAGMEVVVPGPEDRAFVNDRYFSELVESRFLPGTRDAIATVVERMKGIDAVILGGTELPLLLRDARLPVAALDTTAIHVDAALSRLLPGASP